MTSFYAAVALIARPASRREMHNTGHIDKHNAVQIAYKKEKVQRNLLKGVNIEAVRLIYQLYMLRKYDADLV